VIAALLGVSLSIYLYSFYTALSCELVIAALLGASLSITIISYFSTIWPAWKRIREQAAAMKECGHLSDPPTDEDYAVLQRICRFFVNCFVGKIEVVGGEKLQTMQAPYILVFNHGSLLDTAIAPLVLNRKARVPAAEGVTSLLGGLVGYAMSKWGVFPVVLANGSAAFKSAVKVLEMGEIIQLYPEAWTWMDGKIGPFKTGTVRMARQATTELGKTVNIVPAYMHYGRYPGSWIRKFPIPLQWLVPFLFVWRYRRGVKVVVGEPLHPFEDLPAQGAKEATEQLKLKVEALKPAS